MRSTNLTFLILLRIISSDLLPKSNNFDPSPLLQSTKVIEDEAEDQVGEAEVETLDVEMESPEGGLGEDQGWVAAGA